MKVVFLQMVDGNDADHEQLKLILKQARQGSNYNFVVCPRKLKSLSLEDLKAMVRELDDNVAGNK